MRSLRIFQNCMRRLAALAAEGLSQTRTGGPGLRTTDPHHSFIELKTAESLLELNRADIDRHHQQFEDRPAVGTARIGTTPGRQTNAISRHMIRGQLRGGKPARDIQSIVVRWKHEVVA